MAERSERKHKQNRTVQIFETTTISYCVVRYAWDGLSSPFIIYILTKHPHGQEFYRYRRYKLALNKESAEIITTGLLFCCRNAWANYWEIISHNSPNPLTYYEARSWVPVNDKFSDQNWSMWSTTRALFERCLTSREFQAKYELNFTQLTNLQFSSKSSCIINRYAI